MLTVCSRRFDHQWLLLCAFLTPPLVLSSLHDLATALNLKKSKRLSESDLLRCLRASLGHKCYTVDVNSFNWTGLGGPGGGLRSIIGSFILGFPYVGFYGYARWSVSVVANQVPEINGKRRLSSTLWSSAPAKTEVTARRVLIVSHFYFSRHDSVVMQTGEESAWPVSVL